jgi:hypothetical protein
VNDAIAIALKHRSNGILRLGTEPAPAAHTFCSLRGEEVVLARFELFAD